MANELTDAHVQWAAAFTDVPVTAPAGTLDAGNIEATRSDNADTTPASSLADSPNVAEPGPRPEPAPTPAASTATINLQFYAFIPASLGKSFNSYHYPKDLANQAAFETSLKAVSGTWLPEPGTFADNNTGPWLFETDNRGYGGGSHRVGFTGAISGASIGAFGKSGNVFSHNSSGSTHTRWKHTGILTSKGETGSIETASATAAVSSSEKHEDVSSTQSKITVTGAASYPLKTVSIDIDYKLVFDCTLDASGKVNVTVTVTTNVFPAYELIINGTSRWTLAPKGSGPGLINLTSSQTANVGPLSF